MEELRTRKIQEALAVFSANAQFITTDERNNYDKKRLALNDSVISLKSYCGTGKEVTLLSSEVNNDVRLGIVDFNKGILEGIYGKGSIAVTEMKVGFSTGIEADGVETKSFSQTSFNADLEHSHLEISQEGKVIKKIKLSEFVLNGDDATTFYGSRKHFGHPFILAGGVATTVKLIRPSGVTGTEGYLSVDFIGMQAVSARS